MAKKNNGEENNHIKHLLCGNSNGAGGDIQRQSTRAEKQQQQHAINNYARAPLHI